MHEYWERRLDEARKINDQIEADLEVALAEVSPEAAEPVRAVIGGGFAAPSRRRYSRTDRRAMPLRIVAPTAPQRLRITRLPTVSPASGSRAPVALLARRVVGPLWLRGLLAAVYALISNAVLYAGLAAVGATGRISAAASLPIAFFVTSVLVAATGTVAFWTLRQLLTWPDAAFRILGAAALVALLVSFIVTPGATFLAAIVASATTTMSIDSGVVSD